MTTTPTTSDEVEGLLALLYEPRKPGAALVPGECRVCQEGPEGDHGLVHTPLGGAACPVPKLEELLRAQRDNTTTWWAGHGPTAHLQVLDAVLERLDGPLEHLDGVGRLLERLDTAGRIWVLAKLAPGLCRSLLEAQAEEDNGRGGVDA